MNTGLLKRRVSPSARRRRELFAASGQRCAVTRRFRFQTLIAEGRSMWRHPRCKECARSAFSTSARAIACQAFGQREDTPCRRSLASSATPLLLIVATLVGWGFSDERLVELSERSLARYAEQNQLVAKQSTEVARATHQFRGRRNSSLKQSERRTIRTSAGC